MTAKRSLWVLFVTLIVASSIYAQKDDSQFIPGKLVYLQHKKTTVYTTVNSSNIPLYATKTKTYAFVVKVGETFYTGEASKDNSLSGRLAEGLSGVGNFNAKDWAKLDTDNVLLRFEKKGKGWQAIAMTVRQPNGKQNTMYLMSIVGPDGKEQCGKRTGCTGHNWDHVPQPGANGNAAPAN